MRRSMATTFECLRFHGAVLGLFLWASFAPVTDLARIDCTAQILDDEGHHVSLILVENYNMHVTCDCVPYNECKNLRETLMWASTALGDTLPTFPPYIQNKSHQFDVPITAINPIFKPTSAHLRNPSGNVVVPPGKNITILYRLCQNQAPACQNSNPCPGKFCIQTEESPDGTACAPLAASLCSDTHANLGGSFACGTLKLVKTNNTCRVLSDDGFIVYYLSIKAKDCENTTRFLVHHGGVTIAMNSYVMLVDDSDTFNSTCGSAMTSDISCVFKTDSGVPAKPSNEPGWKFPPVPCGRPFTLTPALLRAHSRVRVSCHVRAGNGILKTFFNVIYLNKNLQISSPDSQCSPNSLKFECNFPLSSNSLGFKFEYEIRNINRTDLAPIRTNSSNKLTSTTPWYGEYTCKAWGSYKSCDPSRIFHFKASRSVTVQNCDHKLDGGHHEEPTSFQFIGIVCGIVALILVLIAVWTFLILKKRGVVGSKRWFNQSMRKDCANVPKCLVTSVEKLELAASQLSTNQKKAEELISHSVVTPSLTDARREFDGSVVAILTCTAPEIKCLKSTMVKLQPASEINCNINLVHDFRMMPVYLGQIPRIEEFATFWRIIGELRVGVVVCIVDYFGQFSLPCPNVVQKSNQYGAYSVKKAAVFSLTDNFRVYELEYIKVEKAAKSEPRVLNFIEVAKWPSDPRLLDEVEFYATKRRRVDPLTRAIAVFCRTGTGASCAFVAIHLARQAFFIHRQVNPAGVMRYIRRNRHGAFTQPVKAGLQAHVVYTTLAACLRADEAREKMVGSVRMDGASLYSTHWSVVAGNSQTGAVVPAGASPKAKKGATASPSTPKKGVKV